MGKPYHGDFGLFFKKQQFKLFRNFKLYSYLWLNPLDHLSMATAEVDLRKARQAYTQRATNQKPTMLALLKQLFKKLYLTLLSFEYGKILIFGILS